MNRKDKIIVIMALGLAFCAGWMLRGTNSAGGGLESTVQAQGVALGNGGFVFTSDQSGKLRIWNFDSGTGEAKEL